MILFMSKLLENRVDQIKVSCIECQYLHRPNPVEDIYLCLRDLKEIRYEIDDDINCIKFGFIEAEWVPVYLNEYKSYV